MRVVFSRAARNDLYGIAEYIADREPARAYPFLAEIEAQCRSFGQFPELGRKVEKLGRTVRMFPFRGYIILYRIGAMEVSVERVWHGARNIEALIEDYSRGR